LWLGPLATVAACSDDPTSGGDTADADVVDTVEVDTASGDTVEVDTLTPDTSAPDTVEDTVPVDTVTPDTTPVDTSAPSSVDLTCSVHTDCLTACASGRCEGDRCVFDAPQSGCVIADPGGETGACVDAGAVDPSSACLLCNPEVQADGYTSIVFANDFDGGQSGMEIEKLAETSATWNVSNARAADGTSSLYFGVPSGATYAVGSRAAGRATTPPIRGPGGGTLTLSFELWLETEETAGFDRLRVLVDRGAGGQPLEAWSSDALDGTTHGEFLPVVIDLSHAAVDGMRVIFEFDSIDGIINDFEGAYIDSLRITTGCCAVDAHCTDANACTSDVCEGDGSCSFEPIEGCCLLDGDCGDGDLCTRDVCAESGGQCSYPPIFDCCHVKSDCDDGDPCTEDICPGDGELCRHQPLCCEDDGDCDDEDSCTVGRCSGGQCTYTSSCCEEDVDCDDGDACTTDTCSTQGVCGHDFTYVPGCCRPDILTQRFDAGTPAGWSLSPSTANVGWRGRATDEAPSGSSVLYYGHPTLHYYDSGGANSGTVTTSNVRLPDAVEVRLTMRVKLDVEASPFKDVFTVDALVGDAVVPLLTKADLPESGWQTASVDLSYLAGQNLRLRFGFDTVDSLENATEGVLIDDLRVLSSCQPRPCSSAASCTSPVDCITGACEAGGCAYTGDCSEP